MPFVGRASADEPFSPASALQIRVEDGVDKFSSLRRPRHALQLQHRVPRLPLGHHDF